jgi:uncharacterized membrane protein
MIKRNCSASPRALAAVFASIVAVSFAFGVAFAAQGLWMILPFVGLELLAVAAAFLCYGRHAADFERIEVRDGMLHVSRLEGARTWQWTAPAAWTHLEQPVSQGRGAGSLSHARCRVVLNSRGESVEIGRLLPDERKQALARELLVAMRSATARDVAAPIMATPRGH